MNSETKDIIRIFGGVTQDFDYNTYGNVGTSEDTSNAWTEAGVEGITDNRTLPSFDDLNANYFAKNGWDRFYNEITSLVVNSTIPNDLYIRFYTSEQTDELIFDLIFSLDGGTTTSHGADYNIICSILTADTANEIGEKINTALTGSSDFISSFIVDTHDDVANRLYIKNIIPDGLHGLIVSTPIDASITVTQEIAGADDVDVLPYEFSMACADGVSITSNDYIIITWQGGYTIGWWYEIDGGGSEPAGLSGIDTVVKVSILSTDTEDQVSSKTEGTLNSDSEISDRFVIDVNTNILDFETRRGGLCPIAYTYKATGGELFAITHITLGTGWSGTTEHPFNTISYALDRMTWFPEILYAVGIRNGYEGNLIFREKITIPNYIDRDTIGIYGAEATEITLQNNNELATKTYTGYSFNVIVDIATGLNDNSTVVMAIQTDEKIFSYESSTGTQYLTDDKAEPGMDGYVMYTHNHTATEEPLIFLQKDNKDWEIYEGTTRQDVLDDDDINNWNFVAFEDLDHNIYFMSPKQIGKRLFSDGSYLATENVANALGGCCIDGTVYIKTTTELKKILSYETGGIFELQTVKTLTDAETCLKNAYIGVMYGIRQNTSFVYKSYDLGDTWEALPLDYPTLSLGDRRPKIKIIDDVLYIVLTDAIYYSVNNTDFNLLQNSGGGGIAYSNGYLETIQGDDTSTTWQSCFIRREETNTTIQNIIVGSNVKFDNYQNTPLDLIDIVNTNENENNYYIQELHAETLKNVVKLDNQFSTTSYTNQKLFFKNAMILDVRRLVKNSLYFDDNYYYFVNTITRNLIKDVSIALDINNVMTAVSNNTVINFGIVDHHATTETKNTYDKNIILDFLNRFVFVGQYDESTLKYNNLFSNSVIVGSSSNANFDLTNNYTTPLFINAYNLNYILADEYFGYPLKPFNKQIGAFGFDADYNSVELNDMIEIQTTKTFQLINEYNETEELQSYRGEPLQNIEEFRKLLTLQFENIYLTMQDYNELYSLLINRQPLFIDFHPYEPPLNVSVTGVVDGENDRNKVITLTIDKEFPANILTGFVLGILTTSNNLSVAYMIVGNVGNTIDITCPFLALSETINSATYTAQDFTIKYFMSTYQGGSMPSVNLINYLLNNYESEPVGGFSVTMKEKRDLLL